MKGRPLPRPPEQAAGKPDWLAGIERVNRQALACGLSYGRYLAKVKQQKQKGGRKGRAKH